MTHSLAEKAERKPRARAIKADPAGVASTDRDRSGSAPGLPLFLQRAGRTGAPGRIEAKEPDIERSLDQIAADVEALIRTASGRQLPEPLRIEFEQRFGQSLADVRLLTGPAAERLATSLEAEAVTVGRTILFAPNRYRPETAAGRQLLAHELTHVVQQNWAAVAPLATEPVKEPGDDSSTAAGCTPAGSIATDALVRPTDVVVSQPADPLEVEATQIAEQLTSEPDAAAPAVLNPTVATSPAIARQAVTPAAPVPAEETTAAATSVEDLSNEFIERLKEDPDDTTGEIARRLMALADERRQAVIDRLQRGLGADEWRRFGAVLSETPPPEMPRPRATPAARAAEAAAIERAAAEAERIVAQGVPAPAGPEAALGETAAEPAAEEEDQEADAEAEGAAAETEAAGEAAPGRARRGGRGRATPAPEPVIPPPAPETRPEIELLMPEPPAALGEPARERFQGVQRTAGQAATRHVEHPPATAGVADARGAVTEPETETAARAEHDLVEALGERPEPSPEIEELCDRIYEVIRLKRPPDEESLVDADPSDMAGAAGDQLDQSVQGDVERVEGNYDQLAESPTGLPSQEPTPIESPPAAVPAPEINASAAVPDPIPPENVSLDADVEAAQARVDEAGMNSEPAQLIQSGPVAEARAAQGELAETAQRDPAEVLASQQAAQTQAANDMAALQAAALEALTTSRANTVSGVRTQQDTMVGTEESIRQVVSAQAQAIFTTTQTQVNALLQPLVTNAMNRWETGVAVLSEEFEQHLARVKSWIDERHSGGWGSIVSVWDDLTGLPGWVTEEYDDAEQTFGDSVCALIREISTEVNGVIATCEALIDNARQQIADLFAGLPEGLREWAAAEEARLNGQLDSLQERATSTRDDFNRDLANRAAQAVEDVRQRIHELREAAKGLLGRIADAIGEFLDDPIRFIINGLLELVGIPPSAFWNVVNRIGEVIGQIADDPLGFASNLLAALAKGFQQFFDNFGTHLFNGFINWLFSGLGSVGVQIPTDLSLKGLITFFLQLMGISWPRIRALLVRHVGAENVALIEKAIEVIAALIEQGPEGVFDLLQPHLNPQSILDQVIRAAVDFVIEALVNQVAVRIIALFNPVGAIVQAIEAIYKVLKWIFENAARIFRLVETVVNGVYDILQGNIGGMANAVEMALAGLIPPVIDFLAGYFGLGDLPDKVTETIKRLQNWVEGILDRVIGWLAERGRALLQALGFGGKEGEGAEGERGAAELGAVGDTIPFNAEGESHELWIAESGTETTVMVASERETVSAKLARWTSEAHKLGAQEGRGRALLREAVGKLGDTEREAYQAAVAKQQAEAANQAAAAGAGGGGGETAAPPASSDAAQTFEQEDAQTVEKERALSEVLRELFVLFKERPDYSVIFAEELRLVHRAVQPQVDQAILQLNAEDTPYPTWDAVTTGVRAKDPVLQTTYDRPFLKTEHPFGREFAHDWGTDATFAGIRETERELQPTTDERLRRRINSVIKRFQADHGGVNRDAADKYFSDHKAQLHSPVPPFDEAPTPLERTQAMLWRRTLQGSANIRIRQTFAERVRMGIGPPPGPDLPEAIRLRIWQLLSTATLTVTPLVDSLDMQMDTTTATSITTYLQTEVNNAAGDPRIQRMLEWWRDNILTLEFHHAWPQWLGGAANQTVLRIPRALHNFEGITSGGQTFPGGFHQVFNAKFEANFPDVPLNNSAAWQTHRTTDPDAEAILAQLLIDSYTEVLSGFGPSGPAAVDAFVAEAKKTFDPEA